MSVISDFLKKLKAQIPDNVLLVAVSKTKPISDIQQAYEAGQRVFGENKALELRDKEEVLPKDIEWHFIGHLQTNKVKYIAPFVHLIHAVDSLKLLQAINKEAVKNDRIISCLLQFHIASEETKFGLSLSEAQVILGSEEFKILENVQIAGVMGMATNTDDEALVRKEFGEMKNIFNQLKNSFFVEQDAFKEVSMGMSNDYLWAIQEGSSMVRVGSKIFGVRNYAH